MPPDAAPRYHVIVSPGTPVTDAMRPPEAGPMNWNVAGGGAGGSCPRPTPCCGGAPCAGGCATAIESGRAASAAADERRARVSIRAFLGQNQRLARSASLQRMAASRTAIRDTVALGRTSLQSQSARSLAGGLVARLAGSNREVHREPEGARKREKQEGERNREDDADRERQIRARPRAQQHDQRDDTGQTLGDHHVDRVGTEPVVGFFAALQGEGTRGAAITHME